MLLSHFHLSLSAGSVPKFVVQKPNSVNIRSKCTEIEKAFSE
jgi:hypothetical protein